MTNNKTNNMSGTVCIAEPQRREVVNLLMDLLKTCYPAEHEYLLRRAEQYESMCHTRASNVHHYYQLVNEGFIRIRDAYNDRSSSSAAKSIPAGSASQKMNTNMKKAPTPVAMQTATQATSHPPDVTNQFVGAPFSTPRVSNPPNATNHTNLSNPVLSTNPPSSINPSIPVNFFNSNPNAFIADPSARVNPPQNSNLQVNQLENPAVSHLSGAHAKTMPNAPVNSMVNTLGATTAFNPSLNRMSNQMSPNQGFNPDMSRCVNSGINKLEASMANTMHGQMPNQMANRMANTGQSNFRNPFPASYQTGTAAFNPNVNLPQNRAIGIASTQTARQHSQLAQPQSQGQSTNVNQFLLSTGLIPTGMLPRTPQSASNIQRMPGGISNQIMGTKGTPLQVPGQIATTQETARGNTNLARMRQIPASVAESVTSQPRNAAASSHRRTSPRGLQTTSMSSNGSKMTRSRARAIQRRPRKRNPIDAEINRAIPTPPLQSAQNQNVLNQLTNPSQSSTAKPSYLQAPVQAITNPQRQIHGPSARSTYPQEQVSLSDPSMNERIFISDGIHVSVRQVYTAAASCGYNLTPAIIKALSTEQLLRIFVRARQIALKNASSLTRGEDGKVNISKQHLDALGVEYETTDSEQQYPGNLPCDLNGNQASTSHFDQVPSVPANITVKRSDVMESARNTRLVDHGTNASLQSPTFRKARQPPNHRDSQRAGEFDVAVPRINSRGGPSSSVSQGTGSRKVSQNNKNVSQARANSSTGAEESTVQGVGNTPQSFSTKTAARTNRNFSATLSHRISLFQQKYAVYKSLISQTLSVILSQGHDGQDQVRYLQNALQLLTQPIAMGSNLTQDVLNTTENFLRDFLVRYQGIPMKAKPVRTNQAGASTAGRSSTANKATKTKDSNAPGRPVAQETLAMNARIEKNTEPTPPRNVETAVVPIQVSQVQQQSVDGNTEDSSKLQKDNPADPPAQTPVTLLAVSHGGTQNTTRNDIPTESRNVHSLIARKLHRINHSVRLALHMTENCAKHLEKESMLRLKEERIAEVCYVIQADIMRKRREPNGLTNAEGMLELSLLQLVTEECEYVYEKHKKLMINIEEKWKKPVVECLLAYQSIRLPKIVIHISGTYRKDFSATFGFERPALGWVPVLRDIKKRFKVMVEHAEGVSGILESWATAAAEVLDDDDIC